MKTLLPILVAALLAGCSLRPGAPAIDLSPVAMQDRGSPLEDGWQHGAFMEVFVRGYADSDGDGIGDLRGLIQSLDYLKALGVRGLWLMPVTASAVPIHQIGRGGCLETND